MSVATKKNELSQYDIKSVKEHYEDYPYPLRDPNEEKTRTLQILGDFICEINHWLFRGKQDFSNFRVLIAGGGTGDSTIFLAEQFKNMKVDVVYLDFSKASMKIAQERAKIRGLNNITWIHDSILNLPKLNLGKFNYITCTGVLHHLASPDDGLKALADVLTDDGGMSIMVYGKYGRTGVYQIQEIMNMVNAGVESRAKEIENCKRIMDSAPSTNWYNRGQDLLADHKLFGDVGYYDMFLHKQDRAYSIPELYEYIGKAGLNMVEFVNPPDKIALRLETYIKDPELLAQLKSKDIIEQQAICELLVGSIIKHSFYVSKKKNTVASFDDFDNVPLIYINTNTARQLYEYIENNPTHSSISMTANHNKVQITLPVSTYTKYVFKYMIDEDKSLGEIFDAVEKETNNKIAQADRVREIQSVLMPLADAGMLVLKHKSVKTPMKFIFNH